jgi:hypothetical protein
MLNQWLNPSTIKNLSQFADSFQKAEPFGHVVIDDFFKTSFCDALLSQFPDFKDKDAVDENKTLGRKAVVQTVSQIGPAYKNLDEMVQSDEFLQFVSTITGIDNLLYDPHYIGGGTHNNLNGQELDPHVDFTHHPITSHHRRLNLIVYLNHEWEKQWGGHIEFHKNPRLQPEQDDITSVKPLFNRAVIFETHNTSWHGFPKIELPEGKQHLSRKSFALYYYTHRREQAVEPHSTIYVERHLPKRFETENKLSAEDLATIKNLLNRRDQHLARLYQTITAQTVEISQLKTKILQQKSFGSNTIESSEEMARLMKLLSFDETRLINRVHELENSTSWKITAPLRKIRRWFS